MNPELLKLLAWVVEASKPNITVQNPVGFCYLPSHAEANANALGGADLLQVNPAKSADGSFAVRPTNAGLAMIAQHAQQPAPQALQTQPAADETEDDVEVEIETDVPLPEAKRAGFGRNAGPSLVDKYKFDQLPLGASFFVKQDPGAPADKPKHRTFASTVSSANKKLFPKNFAIREATNKDGEAGARVWRLPDLTGPRPTRKPREPAPAPAQSQAQPLGQPGIAPHPGVFAGQGFPAPPVAPTPAPAGGLLPGHPSLAAPFQGGFPPAGPSPAYQGPASDWSTAPALSGPLPPFTD